MKIKEFAESRKVSNQAVYKAISRAGYSAKQITNKYGNISPQGMRILKKLFPDDLHQDPEPGAGAAAAAAGDQQPGQQDPEPGAAAARSSAGDESKETELLRERIKELENQCAELKAECKEWKNDYRDLEQRKEKEAAEFRLLLHQYKETENKRLIAAAAGDQQPGQQDPEPEKKGFFKRLFHGKKTAAGSIS